MTKFGLFAAGGSKPLQELEGDYMISNQEFVKIFEKGGYDESDQEVVTIHLDKGHIVKKLKET